MNLHITKSKNAESFYIAKSYTKANGKTSSVIVRKLGTLNQLIVEHGPTRDDVLAWAKNEVKLETEKYKKDQQTKAVQITFHSDHKLDYGQQVLYRGGYLFPQTFYTSQIVKAHTQAEMMEVLLPILTEEEAAVYKRGRNAKSFTMAKNATMSDYRKATGFEALMGYLYLKDEFERLVELVKTGVEEMKLKL